MIFAQFALRPAAAQVLEPPFRIPLLVAAFQRFFRMTAVSVLVVVATGFAMFAAVGFRGAPPGWHAMLTLGVVMASVFCYIYGFLFPKLSTLSKAADWPSAAKVLNKIRGLVAFNLTLGVLTIAAAVLAGG